ncbi:hypothetical protein ADZ36_26315 [Streptomyces fradiae]|uniref:Endonuclease/exonuclease/phosphatase family protein n=3 Tax=Streptomyces TaxID=1883 RepID=A0A3R7EQN5_9ACTN|nr:hypothetical protein ADZ36_26315 [Streptomyces fradiae]RKM94086.1 endonuclease/exonuclease/phosphatase family protein [Streptomyces xinghaiensis]RNC69293.1 endonuclease/exonuclease/phosphatase family protein [Streptomyces xinghaiensis]
MMSQRNGTARRTRSRTAAVVAAAVTAALLTQAQAAAGPSAPVPRHWVEGRVMTFNLHMDEHDPADQADLIISKRPQVVALQEACREHLSDLWSRLRERNHPYRVITGYVRTRSDGERNCPGQDYGQAMLVAYEGSDVVVEASGSATYGVRDPDHDEARGFLWIKTKLHRQSTVLHTTHLTNDETAEGVRARAAQVRQLTTHMNVGNPEGRGSVALGDFNAVPGSRELSGLANRGWHDADENCPQACQPTIGESKFDYIWLRRDDYPEQPGLHAVPDDQRRWSDHLTAYADLPRR